MENTAIVKARRAFLERRIEELSEQIGFLQITFDILTKEYNQLEKDLNPYAYDRGKHEALLNRPAKETGRAYVLGYQYGKKSRLPIS